MLVLGVGRAYADRSLPTPFLPYSPLAQNPFWMHILERDGAVNFIGGIFSQCPCAPILIGHKREHNTVARRKSTVLGLMPLLLQN